MKCKRERPALGEEISLSAFILGAYQRRAALQPLPGTLSTQHRLDSDGDT